MGPPEGPGNKMRATRGPSRGDLREQGSRRGPLGGHQGATWCTMEQDQGHQGPGPSRGHLRTRDQDEGHKGAIKGSTGGTREQDQGHQGVIKGPMAINQRNSDTWGKGPPGERGGHLEDRGKMGLFWKEAQPLNRSCTALQYTTKPVPPTPLPFSTCRTYIRDSHYFKIIVYL